MQEREGGDNTQVVESRQVETKSCNMWSVRQRYVLIGYRNGVNNNDQLAVSTSVVFHSFQCQKQHNTRGRMKKQ